MKIVTRIAHGKTGIFLNFIPGARILNMVTRKFTELIVIETVMRIRAAAPTLSPMAGEN
jgi:hypothetical protein